MTTESISTVFDAFVAAKQALDELPAAREALARVKAESAYLHVLAKDLREELSRWQTEANTLKATLADREVALTAATFRESQVRAQFEALRSAMAMALGQVEPTIVSVVVSTNDESQSQAAASTHNDETLVMPEGQDSQGSTVEPIQPSLDQSEGGPTHSDDVGQSDDGPTPASVGHSQSNALGHTASSPGDKGQSEAAAWDPDYVTWDVVYAARKDAADAAAEAARDAAYADPTLQYGKTTEPSSSATCIRSASEQEVDPTLQHATPMELQSPTAPSRSASELEDARFLNGESLSAA